LENLVGGGIGAGDAEEEGERNARVKERGGFLGGRQLGSALDLGELGREERLDRQLA